jgi:hypothetical protein
LGLSFDGGGEIERATGQLELVVFEAGQTAL